LHQEAITPQNVIYFDTQRFNYVIASSTTYGTWLPGDARGFVERGICNEFSTPCNADIPELKAYAEREMKESPIFFNIEQANLILTHWRKVIPTVGWYLFAVAIMPNHFHVVLASPTGQRKEDYLRTLKARASFALNKKYGKRTWWTVSGSVRYCFDEHALDARIEYVMNQENPLVVWRNSEEFCLR
jgi:REP element-mobilizing transposase RayT